MIMQILDITNNISDTLIKCYNVILWQIYIMLLYSGADFMFLNSRWLIFKQILWMIKYQTMFC